MSDRGMHRGGGPPRGRGGENPRGRGFDRGGGGRGFDRGGRGRGGFTGPLIFQENTAVQVPSRLSDPALQQLISNFKSMKVQPEHPIRPGYGTKGTPIMLRANFFAVKVPQGPIYDYVVEISPRTDLNKIKTRLFELLERTPLCQPHLPYIAHDRSQRLVSARKLPQPLDIRIPFIEDGAASPSPKAQVYTMSIRFERELDPRQLVTYVESSNWLTKRANVPACYEF